MSDLRIISNNHRRDVLYWQELTETRKACENAGLHPFYIGLFRLFRAHRYTVYTNDGYTSGVIETPSGWVDHWIRYTYDGSSGRRFAYDAPEKIAPHIRRRLESSVLHILDQQEV